jgi:hypothetical protein
MLIKNTYFFFQVTMTDYQYGLSNIQDNHILQQIIAKRKKMCESLLDDPLSEFFVEKYRIYISLCFSTAT